MTGAQRGPEIRSDEEDYGTQGRRIRTKEHRPKQKISRVYHGKKAYRLFLQAYQHILWKQCYALINEQSLPAELWTVVRDLWSLRLSRLLPKLEQSPGDDDTDTVGLSSGVDSLDESGGEGQVRNPKLASGSPSLIDTICLCYMAMLLLRLPIRLSQILRWIREEHVPFIRAIRHVPADMRDKLPGEYHEALDTSTILRREMLQRGVSNLCALYSRSYGMNIAPLNSTLMLFHYVENLSLPLEVYAAVQHLNDIVGFKYHYVDPEGTRRRAISYPEAQLMSLVVVATKLLFPFDSNAIQRSPRNDVEQGMASLDWSTWAEGRELPAAFGPSQENLTAGMEMEIKDTDVFDMSPSQLDQYMEWYQRTWASTTTADEDVNGELLAMFPIGPTLPKPVHPATVLHDEDARRKRVREVQARLKMNEVITDQEATESATEVIRLGMQYQEFRDHKALSFSPIAKMFHIEAAELSCLSLDMLLRAVRQTERKILLWRQAKRRAEKFGEEVESALPPGLEGLDQMTLAEAAVGTEATDSGEDQEAMESGSDDASMEWE